jgi:hypothetical protein
MSERYLLYIDILGFANLVSADAGRVETLYAVIDSLNVHRHDMFETIVFSDTVLVYNRHEPKSERERKYIVWYSIEFAEDLHHRLTGQGIYFRAVLLKGQFRHYAMENLQAFFGQALISAYLTEKQIPSLGLFITDQCNEDNEYFRTSPFGNGLNFVYLNRAIENLCRDTNDTFPVAPGDFVHLADGYPYLAWQVRFLSDVYSAMRNEPDPTIRTKFLTAWDFYIKRYPNLLTRLVQMNFSLDAVSPGFNFSAELAALEEFMAEFGNETVA